MIFPAFSTAHWVIALVNHLWQSTAFAVVVWLLTFALRRNQAHTRHCLWVLASAKFLVPLSLLISAGGWLQARIHTPAAQPVTFSIVMEGLTEPFAADEHAVTPAAAAPVADTDSGAGASHHTFRWLAPSLLSLWACGSLLLLAGGTRRWWALQRTVHSASLLFTVSGVPVMVASLHMEPGVFGVFSPVILVPQGIRERLSSAQFDAILAHELCHVRRRDNLIAMLHMAVEAVFWFFPVVWWVRQGLLEERERACDEAVLDSSREAMVYAEGIINVCKFYVEAPMSCVAGVTGSDLKKRIVRIMEEQVARKLDFGRKLLLLTAAILVVVLPVGVGLVHAATGQMIVMRGNGIEGSWQGTVPSPIGDRRIVVQINKDVSSALSATVIMLDMAGPGQGAEPLQTSDVTFTDNDLKFSLAFMGSSFDGKMSSDHNSIEGSWTGHQGTQHLVLERATPDTAWVVPQPPPRMNPMAADANPGIEVATIKPTKPGAMVMKRIRNGGGRLIMNNVSLQDLIIFAYDVEPKQIANAPSWLNSETYDIQVQPDQPGAPSPDQWRVLIQKLLSDRFQLKFHGEQRELSAYMLVVSKDGPKMTKSAPPASGQRQGLFIMRPGNFNAQAMSMAQFVHSLQSGVPDRPVIDQTGLTGLWTFSLKWTPDESQFGGMMRGPAPPSDDSADAPPPLFTALQEQLGLKLESGKAQVPVLVLDRVEKPSAN